MRINSKKYKGLFITLVGVLFVLSIGITYAYFSLGVSGNNNATNMTTTMGTLKITYEETNNIVAENIEPKWTASKTITVENTGSLPATYSLLWDTLTNEITNNELIMSLSCTSNGISCSNKNINVTLDTTNDIYSYTHASNAVVPSSGSNKNIQTDFEIEAGKTHTIVLTFYFKETNTTQDYNQGKTFTCKLKVGEKAPTVVNSIVKGFIQENTINFKQPSSASNGEGLFKYTKLSSPLISGQSNVIDDSTGFSQEDIYYYRGNITNNNVIFGGYCWLIVRTTDTGGTKLLYNGPVQETEIKCPSYRTTSPSNDEPFNATSVKWASTSPYADVRYAGSGPKNALDNWYSTWITNNPEIEDKLESIVWCNDVNNQTLLESAGDYPAKTRLKTNSVATPQLECKYASDRYTSKIGLLTADEAVLAGQAVLVNDSTNKNSYINVASKTWWLGSPCGSNSGGGDVFLSYGGSADLSYNFASNGRGVRGSVSLSPSIQIESGTGTPTDPYVVE